MIDTKPGVNPQLIEANRILTQRRAANRVALARAGIVRRRCWPSRDEQGEPRRDDAALLETAHVQQ